MFVIHLIPDSANLEQAKLEIYNGIFNVSEDIVIANIFDNS